MVFANALAMDGAKFVISTLYWKILLGFIGQIISSNKDTYIFSYVTNDFVW